ncbi:MAG: BamA/TamA family outer membrane protein [Polyangiaceae bacterium]
MHAATGGPDWLAAGFTERFRFADGNSLSLNATGIRRPDHAFFGIGPRSLQDNLARYSSDSLDANTVIDFDLWRASRVTTTFGARTVSFSPGHFGEDSDVEGQVARGVFPLPDGYDSGYTLEYNQVDAAFDTRLPRPSSGSGVRIEGTMFQGNDVRRSPAGGFVRYGGTVGGFWDLNDHGRVVSLSVGASFADPLGKEAIPFTELVALGGYDAMRGFLPGRLYGRSSAVSTLHYRWPIWAYIDGSIELATGNVFDEHLKDFDPRLLRLSGAMGIETVGSPDNSLEILVGAGTETFDDRLKLDSVRLLLGTNRGF